MKERRPCSVKMVHKYKILKAVFTFATILWFRVKILIALGLLFSFSFTVGGKKDSAVKSQQPAAYTPLTSDTTEESPSASTSPSNNLKPY